MRNLEERIAEINRRSKKIIKERKQRRKHIVMACIPLAVVGLCVAFAFPGYYDPPKSAEGKPEAMPEDFYPAGMVDEITEAVVEVQVEGVTICYSYSASSKVQSITGQLEDFSTRAPASGALQDAEDVQEDDSRNTTDAANPAYEITLVLADGSTKVYILVGNQLTDCTAGQNYTLTNQQLWDLKTQLGIPLY